MKWSILPKNLGLTPANIKPACQGQTV